MNPFVGLRPFKEHDRELFFGRSREQEILLNLVYSVPIVVVFAPSGRGKSSLIRAGVAPVLGADASMKVISVWQWKTGVFAELRARIGRSIDQEDRQPSDSISERFEDYWKRTRRKPVLILDQFEEVLRYGEELEQLWDELSLIANEPQRHARVLLSIREDYLAGLDELMTRVPGLLDNRLRIGRLSLESLHEALLCPLEKGDPVLTVEEELVKELLEDLQRSAIQDPLVEDWVEPGYFQVVCRHLWNLDHVNPKGALTLRTYREAGRASGIIDSFIRGILERVLSEEQRQVLFAISRYMVLPTGAKVSLSAEDLAGLVRLEDFTDFGRSELRLEAPPAGDRDLPFRQEARQWMLLQPVLDKLCRSDALIFRRVRRGGRIEYQLAHDLLGPILLEWREYEVLESTRILRQRYEQTLEERALSDDQLQIRARWQERLRSVEHDLRSEEEDDRVNAVYGLASLMIQAQYLDPNIHSLAKEQLRHLASDSSPIVRREALRALEAAEDRVYTSDEVAVRPTRLLAPVSFWRFVAVTLFYLAFSGASTFLIAFAIDRLASSMGWVSAVEGKYVVFSISSLAWAYIYVFQTFDRGALRDNQPLRSLFAAPFDPYDWGVDWFESSAGWPFNFVIGTGVSDALAIAAVQLIPWGWSGIVVLCIALALLTWLSIVAYNDAVILF
jgi:hypothetical protein